MRPYRLVEETVDDEDEHPRVVSLGGVGRSRAGALGLTGRPQPWTARDIPLPAAPARLSDELTAARPSAGLSPLQKWMIGGFLVICAGMVLGMVMVRVWDTASRAVAGLPPEGAVAASRPAGSVLPAPGAPASDLAPALPGTGPVTTEIQVLQPNYTVAPGDTLGIIARRHGSSVDALASMNNLENRNSLSVGQKLIIP